MRLTDSNVGGHQTRTLAPIPGMGHRIMGHQIVGHQIVGDQIMGHQIVGPRIMGHHANRYDD